MKSIVSSAALMLANLSGVYAAPAPEGASGPSRSAMAPATTASAAAAGQARRSKAESAARGKVEPARSPTRREGRAKPDADRAPIGLCDGS